MKSRSMHGISAWTWIPIKTCSISPKKAWKHRCLGPGSLVNPPAARFTTTTSTRRSSKKTILATTTIANITSLRKALLPRKKKKELSRSTSKNSRKPCKKLKWQRSTTKLQSSKWVNLSQARTKRPLKPSATSLTPTATLQTLPAFQTLSQRRPLKTRSSKWSLAHKLCKPRPPWPPRSTTHPPSKKLWIPSSTSSTRSSKKSKSTMNAKERTTWRSLNNRISLNSTRSGKKVNMTCCK